MTHEWPAPVPRDAWQPDGQPELGVSGVYQARFFCEVPTSKLLQKSSCDMTNACTASLHASSVMKWRMRESWYRWKLQDFATADTSASLTSWQSNTAPRSRTAVETSIDVPAKVIDVRPKSGRSLACWGFAKMISSVFRSFILSIFDSIDARTRSRQSWTSDAMRALSVGVGWKESQIWTSSANLWCCRLQRLMIRLRGLVQRLKMTGPKTEP